MAAAIEQALSMPQLEQQHRMRLMRDMVRSHNVYRWAGQMLFDAAQIRKRRRIVQLVSRRHVIPLPISRRQTKRAPA